MNVIYVAGTTPSSPYNNSHFRGICLHFSRIRTLICTTSRTREITNTHIPNYSYSTQCSNFYSRTTWITMAMCRPPLRHLGWNQRQSHQIHFYLRPIRFDSAVKNIQQQKQQQQKLNIRVLLTILYKTEQTITISKTTKLLLFQHYRWSLFIYWIMFLLRMCMIWCLKIN